MLYRQHLTELKTSLRGSRWPPVWQAVVFFYYCVVRGSFLVEFFYSVERALLDLVIGQEVVARIQSFADAVPAISNAYWGAGGTADGGPGTNSPSGPCRAAYAAATGALAAAYNYDGKVLFKPTFTTTPYTYRVELSGALSYFIGTNCLKIARL